MWPAGHSCYYLLLPATPATTLLLPATASHSCYYLLLLATPSPLLLLPATAGHSCFYLLLPATPATTCYCRPLPVHSCYCLAAEACAIALPLEHVQMYSCVQCMIDFLIGGFKAQTADPCLCHHQTLGCATAKTLGLGLQYLD